MEIPPLVASGANLNVASPPPRSNARAVAIACLSVCASACAAVVSRPTVTSTANVSVPDAGAAVVANRSARRSALDQWVLRWRSGEPGALLALDVRLAATEGARELSGEPAADERVANVTVLAWRDDSAMVLTRSSCGNVWLSSVRWSDGNWARAESIVVVDGQHPGRCGQLELRAQPVALSSDARDEAAITWSLQDVTGESVRGPFLDVVQLRTAGHMHPLLHHAPFGSVDDMTGATTVGVISVVDDLPAPRPLVVSIHAGRRGPPGSQPSPDVERTYRIRGDALVLTHESRDGADAP